MSYSLTQRYTLDNPPSLEKFGFTIEQEFLRHIKVGNIPDLKQYLDKLNADDWTCLLAENPREEFFKYLPYKIKAEIDWQYVIDRQASIQQNILANNGNARAFKAA